MFTKKEESLIKIRLKELRQSLGLNQRQMAEELTMSRSCWSNYENGYRMPSVDTLKRVANYCGVDVNYIIGVESVNQDIGEFLYYQRKFEKYLTKEGHLDLSKLTVMSRIMLMNFYKFLVIQDTMYNDKIDEAFD